LKNQNRHWQEQTVSFPCLTHTHFSLGLHDWAVAIEPTEASARARTIFLASNIFFLFKTTQIVVWVSYPVVLCPSNLEHMVMAKPSPKHAGNETLVSLGLAIRTTRLTLGLSQEALAVDAEFDRSYMGGVERGEHNLTLMGLTKIAAALNLKPSVLLQRAGI
jgi:DNA-binding XRE family transcriptional regulator